MQVTILGSGSSGNCAYLETDQARLLVDAGLSGRQIRQRLLSIGRAPENLTGILITHEHSDHIQGLTGLAAKLNIPVFCNRLTKEAIEATLQLKLDFRLFNTGASFEVGDVSVDTFSIPHDAYDPVGFLVHTPEGNIGFLTDLGHATKLILQRVRSANVLVLEPTTTGRCCRMTFVAPGASSSALSAVTAICPTRPPRKLWRKSSPPNFGILSGHLSSDCNKPELANRTITEKVQQLGATHIQVETTSQDVPCPTLAMATARGLLL